MTQELGTLSLTLCLIGITDLGVFITRYLPLTRSVEVAAVIIRKCVVRSEMAISR